MNNSQKSRFARGTSLIVAIIFAMTTFVVPIFAQEVTSKKVLASYLVKNDVVTDLVRDALVSSLENLDEFDPEVDQDEISEEIESILDNVNTGFSFVTGNMISEALMEDLGGFLEMYVEESESRKDAVKRSLQEVKVGNPEEIENFEYGKNINNFPNIAEEINEFLLGDSTNDDGVKILTSLLAFVAKETDTWIITNGDDKDIAINDELASEVLIEDISAYTSFFYDGQTVEDILITLSEIVNAYAGENEMIYFKNFIKDIDDEMDDREIFLGTPPKKPGTSNSEGNSGGGSGGGGSNTGDSNTGDSNTGDSNTGDSNTGDSNTGDSNTEDSNTEDSNTGDSNTETEKTLEDAITQVKETKTEQETKEVVQDLSEKLQDLVTTKKEEVTQDTTQTAQQKAVEVVKKTAEALTSVLKSTETVKDKEAAKEVFTQLKTAVKEVNQLAKDNQETVGEVLEGSQKVAQKLVESVGKFEADATEENGNVKVDYSVEDDSAIEQLIAKVQETTEFLNESLEELGAEKKVESVLTLSAKTTETTEAQPEKNVEFSVDKKLLSVAAEKGVQKVALESKLAKVTLPTKQVSAQAGEKVVLSVEAPEKETLSKEVQEATGDAPLFSFKLTVGEETVSKFDEPVEVEFPYEPKEGEDPTFVNVFYIAEDGTLTPMKARYDAQTGTVKFKTNHFSFYTAKYNRVTFTDLAQAAWAKNVVEEMASKTVVNGLPNGTFNPNATITRAEFVTLLVNAFDIPMVEGEAKMFEDVTTADWFYKQVQTAYQAGIVKGVSNSAFAPKKEITRQDMTVMLRNAWVKYVGTSTTDETYLNRFVDNADIAAYAKASVAASVRIGWLQGKGAGKFDPKGNATRAEAAVLIQKVYNQR